MPKRTFDTSWFLAGIVLRAFDFEGRSPRSTGFTFAILCSLIAFVAELVRTEAFDYGTSHAFRQATITVLMVPMLAWSVRRCHDFGHRGWIAIPLAITLVALNFEMPKLLDQLVNLVGLMILGTLFLVPPDKGTNAYGPDPRARAAAAA